MSMDTFEDLNKELLSQRFESGDDLQAKLKLGLLQAKLYAETENSISVLSDLRLDKSYIYYGNIASRLGIEGQSGGINSIWEDEILNRVHPDDLLGKHMLELHFFQFLKNVAKDELSSYHIVSYIRILDRTNEYIIIQHRMFYIGYINTNPWLALCLYNYSLEKQAQDSFDGKIVNSVTGEIINMENNQCDLLSSREKEVLLLIREGRKSREISEILSISKHTVDRHRQNILAKLRVGNSIEACKVSEMMNLF